MFDDEGNGALHARVTIVRRGELIQFVGPLGFAGEGFALDMVHRVTFVPLEEGTLVQVSVRGVGELQDGWPEAVQGVWRHFLEEAFRPYAEEA